MRPDYDFGKEVDFGLTVILDGLARSIPDQGVDLPTPRSPTTPAKSRP
jgi:hypothetical protein